MLYDLIIIGGGPAGCAGAVYAGRKELKTAIFTTEFGGQSVVSPEIKNWIGEKAIPGYELAKKLKEHVYDYENSVDIFEGYDQKIVSVSKTSDGTFIVKNEKGEEYETRAILVASGSSRRKLDIPGAEEYEGKGVVYCASCDGPLFSGKDVLVVGGGNAGFETALQLSAYCPKVYLVHRSENFKADAVTVDSARAKDNIELMKTTEPVEISGDGDKVTSVKIKNTATGDERELQVEGVFVEIGQIPNNDFIRGVVDLNDYGKIIVNHKTQQSNTPGLWGAGDITDGLYHQNNIAMGDAVKAIENIYIELNKTNK